MAIFTIKERPETDPVFERVPVPEFGQGEDGTDYEVNVRGLTIAEWDWMIGRGVNHRNPGEIREDYNELILAAALAAYDDDGRLVFGATREEAIYYLSALDREYRPALARIHAKVLAMSGFSQGGLNEGVEVAEKN